MSRPKLPSELHPDYPKGTYNRTGIVTMYTPAPAESFIKFYKDHPEFQDEGDYELLCPFCYNPVEDSGPGAACCGEYARGEWTLIDSDGNIKE